MAMVFNGNRVGPQAGYAIGLMSGTSGDGIDAALVHFRERADRPYPDIELHATFYRAFQSKERDQVFRLFEPDVSARYVAEMDTRMGQWFGEAVVALLAKAQLQAEDVTVVGSHGQTVFHYPDQGFTLQIGDATVMANLCGIPVVSDFRRADMAVAGQGAPLVPYFDYGYLRSPEKSRVALNIGGISNVTILNQGASEEELIAFDTGPGNMVIDGLVQRLSNGRQVFDEGGRLAAAGQVHFDLVAAWIQGDAYFAQTGPKSTGRERYGAAFIEQRQQEMVGLPIADQVATMTYFVAKTIALGIEGSVHLPYELVVGGGGRHNQTLLTWLAEFTQAEALFGSEQLGIQSDMKEAMAFALFAWQFVHNRPTNFPSATGASRKVRLGNWTPANTSKQADR